MQTAIQWWYGRLFYNLRNYLIVKRVVAKSIVCRLNSQNLKLELKQKSTFSGAPFSLTCHDKMQFGNASAKESFKHIIHYLNKVALLNSKIRALFEHQKPSSKYFVRKEACYVLNLQHNSNKLFLKVKSFTENRNLLYEFTVWRCCLLFTDIVL